MIPTPSPTPLRNDRKFLSPISKLDIGSHLKPTLRQCGSQKALQSITLDSPDFQTHGPHLASARNLKPILPNLRDQPHAILPPFFTGVAPTTEDSTNKRYHLPKIKEATPRYFDP
jgi:hypothetical protein